jgi:hypothetical protein
MSSNSSSDGSTLTSSGNLTTFVIPGMNSMRIAVLLHHEALSPSGRRRNMQVIEYAHVYGRAAFHLKYPDGHFNGNI